MEPTEAIVDPATSHLGSKEQFVNSSALTPLLPSLPDSQDTLGRILTENISLKLESSV